MTETFVKMADPVGPTLSFSVHTPTTSSSSSKKKKVLIGLSIFLLAAGFIAFTFISKNNNQTTVNANALSSVITPSPVTTTTTPTPIGVGESGDVMGIFDKSGDVTVYGRNLHWKASGYLKGFSWRYKAEVTDSASKVKGSASGFKSGKGAVEHATAECFKAMIAKGIIPPPPAVSVVEHPPLDSLDASSLNAPEDPIAEEQPVVVEETPAPVSTTEETPVHVIEEKPEETPVVEETSTPVIEQEQEQEIDVMESKVLTKTIRDALDQSSEEFQSVYTVSTSNGEEQTVQGVFDKSGDTVVYGRKIHWKASGGLKGFKWVYKATAKDVVSGVTGSSSGKKSGQGAVEWAVKDCFQKLISQGIIIVPSAISHEIRPSSPSTSSSSSSTPSSILTTSTSSLEDSPLALIFSKLSQPRQTILSSDDDPFQALFSSITRFADVMDGFHNALNKRKKSALSSVLSSQKTQDNTVQGIFDKSGDQVVYGRTIHWKATGYLKGLSWRYKATATDKQTGVSSSVSGYKSGQGAVENAIKEVFQKLIAGGYITIPPQ